MLIRSQRRRLTFNSATTRPRLEFLDDRLAPASMAPTLDGANNLVITDTIGVANSTTISVSAANVVVSDAVEQFTGTGGISGAVLSNGNKTLTVPLTSITGTAIVLNAGGGSDTLTMNLAGGSFGKTLDYHGGSGTSDALLIAAGNQGTVTYSFSSVHDGSIVMSNFGTVNYTGLEPITNSGTVTDAVFNLPSVTNSAVLSDDGTSGNGLTRLSSSGTFELVDFTNPTNSLTINRGSASDDIALDTLADFNATMTIGGAVTPFDQATTVGAIGLGAGKAISIHAQSIAVNASITVSADVTLSATNGVTLGAALNTNGGNLTINADSDADGSGTFAFTTPLSNTWEQEQQMTASGGGSGDSFGNVISVSSDGNTMVVGAYRDDVDSNGNQGSATVFTRSGNVWTQQQLLTAAGGAADDSFGRSVSLSSDGNTVIVGAPTANGGQGTAIVFTRSAGAWTQQQQLVPTGAAANADFGRAVALSGDGNTAIVGADNETVDAREGQGRATVFVRSAGVWTEQQQLTASSGAAFDFFGYSAALNSDGNTAIFGVVADDVGGNADQGTAIVFTRSGSTWTQQQQLTATDGAAGDRFGRSVALSSDGNTAVVGGEQSLVGAGAVTVFGRSGGVWIQQQKLVAPAGVTNDRFGEAVALSGDGNVAIVGAAFDDVASNDDQGSAFVFTQVGGTWTPRQQLTAPNGTTGDEFGLGLALSGDGSDAFVGSPTDDVGGNSDQGSTWAFQRISTSGSIQTGLGAVTIMAADVNVTGGITSNSLVTIAPSQSGRPISVGSNVAGSLGLTQGELDHVAIPAAATLNIGSSDCGPISVTSAITRTSLTNLNLTSNADIVLANSIDTAGGQLNLFPGLSNAAIRPTKSGTDVVASSVLIGLDRDLAIDIGGTALDSGYSQFNTTGSIVLSNVDLVLTGSYVPVPGDVFTIVAATGGRSGFFTGLPNNATQMFNGVHLQVQYSSTTVTLRTANNPIITSNGGNATANVTVFENSTAVTTVAATDADLPAQTLTYSIVGGADAANFTINPTSGVLAFTQLPNYEAPDDVGSDNVYDVTVAVSDGSLIDTQAIAVTVGDANDPPTLVGPSQSIVQVSANGSGIQGDQGSASSAVSADGRFVTFASDASNLVNGDTNGTRDVFRKDLQTGAIVRVSADSAGAQSNDVSSRSDISDDGRYVVFESFASNFVTGDTNGRSDVFRKDLQTGAIVRVSTDSGGGQANGNSSTPVVSADGRYVVFKSIASNLVSGDSNGTDDVFCKDLQTGIIVCVSTDSGGMPANSASDSPVISADGRYVAFRSFATNLVSGDTNGWTDVFRKDLQTGTIVRASTDSGGGQTIGESRSPSISADGRYVVVQSEGALVSGDTNEAFDVFRKDLQTGAIVRATTNAAGGQGNGLSTAGGSTISADGRFVVFYGPASNLVSGDTNGAWDVFRKDLLTGAIVRVSAVANGGQGNDHSSEAIVSDDGQYVVFSSSATNLVNSDTNGTFDVFRVFVNPVSASENATFVFDFDATDPDVGQARTYSVVGGADAALFEINVATGVLSFHSAPNFESPSDVGGDNVYDVVVQVSDGNLTDELALAVPVTNLDEVLITSNGGGAAASVTTPENSVFVTTVSATDPDGTSQTITYSIVGGADSSRFSINPSSGDLAFKQPPNYETPTDVGNDNVYDVVVAASDGGAVGSQSIAVSVADIDERPTLIRPAKTVVYASANASSTQANLPSYLPKVSADGRYVVFDTSADNLVSGDTNGFADVFRKDVKTGTILRVSIDEAGVQASGSSEVPDVSSDGRYVVFLSDASNLVSGDTNGTYDIFRKDLNTGAIVRVSTDALGGQANGSSTFPVMSADGRYVVFQSDANNLVSGDSNGAYDVFCKDLQSGTITRVSSDSGDGQGNDSSFAAEVSADGRYVVFSSHASNFVPGDTNNTHDVFRKDLQTGALVRVSVGVGGGQANSPSSPSAVSADGRYVVFQSTATNLVSGDTNILGDIFRKDLQTGATVRVNTDSAEGQTNIGDTFSADASTDGRYVVFSSLANNLVSGDTNGRFDVFRKDVDTGAIVRVSTNGAGESANDDAYSPVVSADGRFVVFASYATNLLASDANGRYQDILWVDLPTNATMPAQFVAENTSYVFDFDFLNQDAGQTHTYAITAGADATLLTIDSASGVLSFIAAPNYETPGDSGGDNVYDVVVQITDGTLSDSLAVAVTVTDVNEPTITSISPFIGPTSGGNTVVISGDYFTGATSVKFGSANAASFTVISASQITAVAPAGASTINVVVTTGNGVSVTSTSNDDYTYATPSVTSVVLNGGTIVAKNRFGQTPSLANQNSVVEQILVTFNMRVKLDPDAFAVSSLAESVNVTGITASPNGASVTATGVSGMGNPTDGYTQYVLTFDAGAGVNGFANNIVSPALGNAFTTMKDGLFSLNMTGAKVHAGVSDTAANYSEKFWVLFGATNAGNIQIHGALGDASTDTLIIDSTNLNDLYATFGSSAQTPLGPPVYRASLDFDLDGNVDSGDINRIYPSFGTIWKV